MTLSGWGKQNREEVSARLQGQVQPWPDPAGSSGCNVAGDCPAWAKGQTVQHFHAPAPASHSVTGSDGPEDVNLQALPVLGVSG